MKQVLALANRATPSRGATLLIYHRIGGGTRNELDLPVAAFARQMQVLAERGVVSLDDALDRLDAGDETPSFVITFDDGFDEVYRHAWPVLRELNFPFTIYLASAYVDAEMRWEGSTAKGRAGHGLSWRQLTEMVESGLCTVGNHTHDHVRPELLGETDLDECTDVIENALGIPPRHFAYPWGHPVPELEPVLRKRFRSASTGELGRNLTGANRLRLRRVPVRRTDPAAFFAAKLSGNLIPERAYESIVRLAKHAG